MAGCALLWACGRGVSVHFVCWTWGDGADVDLGGGCRYQNSVGCARKVVRLLEEYEKGVSEGAKL